VVFFLFVASVHFLQLDELFSEKGRGHIDPNPKMASFVHCIRIGLMVTIAVTSLTTLLGWPSLVKEHWASGYGDMFIPGQMDVTQKRFLTGKRIM
jgi:hypothetical protein